MLAWHSAPAARAVLAAALVLFGAALFGVASLRRGLLRQVLPWSPLQGFYSDWRERAPPGYGSKYRTAAALVASADDVITLVGSDDGVVFWTLRGRELHDDGGADHHGVRVSFAPKGGPADLSASVSSTTIAWEGAEGRSHRPKPMYETTTPIGGLFTDPERYDLAKSLYAGQWVLSDGSVGFECPVPEQDWLCVAVDQLAVYAMRKFAPRVISEPGERLRLVGSDDGAKFFVIDGRVDDRPSGAVVFDFSPTGGSAERRGIVAGGRLAWLDGPSWPRNPPVDELPSWWLTTVFTLNWADGNKWRGEPRPIALAPSTSTATGGLFIDPARYAPAGPSFSGFWMVSDRFGLAVPDGRLTLVGSDDGKAFWTIEGRVVDRASGDIVADFSPSGGPAMRRGVIGREGIAWSDGPVWPRMAPSHPAHGIPDAPPVGWKSSEAPATGSEL